MLRFTNLFGLTNVIIHKSQHNAVNTGVNEMCQRAFNQGAVKTKKDSDDTFLL